jgi:alkanesulfonate monooxygenase SsuD/methylene tetrahydromethanopterin reductase-like flavin-dependent oxidoreductase (luciferase family)
VCDAVEGRFLQAPDVTALREAAVRAEAEGADAVFLTDGPLGDAVVLLAALSTATDRVLLGVRAGPSTGAHRHPTVLARELTTLDHLSEGRTILSFSPPFTEEVTEAITLCRDMWRDGTATSVGPHYRVPGAVNRPQPANPTSPLLALDLTDGATPPPGLTDLVDLVLWPTADDGVCRIQRT